MIGAVPGTHRHQRRKRNRQRANAGNFQRRPESLVERPERVLWLPGYMRRAMEQRGRRHA